MSQPGKSPLHGFKPNLKRPLPGRCQARPSPASAAPQSIPSLTDPLRVPDGQPRGPRAGSAPNAGGRRRATGHAAPARPVPGQPCRPRADRALPAPGEARTVRGERAPARTPRRRRRPRTRRAWGAPGGERAVPTRGSPPCAAGSGRTRPSAAALGSSRPFQSRPRRRRQRAKAVLEHQLWLK